MRVIIQRHSGDTSDFQDSYVVTDETGELTIRSQDGGHARAIYANGSWKRFEVLA